MLLAAFLGACAHGPHPSLGRYPLDYERVSGQPFDHIVAQAREHGDVRGRLNVYLDGDGRPFLTPTRVAADPTPARSLMLELMALDSGPAVYVSRPCYFLAAEDPSCHPRYWTTARYSEAVVVSLATVIAGLAQRHETSRLTLIGHSGGGTLAVLVASRIPEVDRVITLSGNLDPGAWAKIHGYSALTDSLSPMDVVLAPNVTELHLIGARDPEVPPATVSAYVRAPERQRANFVACELAGCGHENCWRRGIKGGFGGGRRSDWERILRAAETGTCDGLQRGVNTP